MQIDNVQVIEEGRFFNTINAEVTIGRETRTLKGYSNGDMIRVPGIAVRMGRSGMKTWRGEAILWIKSGNISITRTGNFRNPHGNGLSVVGFYDAAKNVCQHSSQFVAK
jgi:hypothetical protein